MTVLPLAECCQLLAIDPKTVRHWVKLSRMSLVSHPTDARVKCLTEEHVHQLATTHARPIALPKALAHSPGEEARAAQHALGLLQEQTQRDEQRLQMLEALIQSPGRQDSLSQALQTMSGPLRQEEEGGKDCRLHPAEVRARSRVIPLIDYGAAGTYVVICPQDGELLLAPDSPAWFDWLATLSSFRFVGKQGQFTA